MMRRRALPRTADTAEADLRIRALLKIIALSDLRKKMHFTKVKKA